MGHHIPQTFSDFWRPREPLPDPLWLLNQHTIDDDAEKIFVHGMQIDSVTQ